MDIHSSAVFSHSLIFLLKGWYVYLAFRAGRISGTRSDDKRKVYWLKFLGTGCAYSVVIGSIYKSGVNPLVDFIDSAYSAYWNFTLMVFIITLVPATIGAIKGRSNPDRRLAEAYK